MGDDWFGTEEFPQFHDGSATLLIAVVELDKRLDGGKERCKKEQECGQLADGDSPVGCHGCADAKQDRLCGYTDHLSARGVDRVGPGSGGFDRRARPLLEVVRQILIHDNDVVDVAKSIKPSPRGELEITDVNKVYLERKALKVELFDRGTAWLDTGTIQSLLDAANFIRVLEERQGLKIGCPEEVAYRQSFIDGKQLESLAQSLGNSGYGQYLLQLLENRH